MFRLANFFASISDLLERFHHHVGLEVAAGAELGGEIIWPDRNRSGDLVGRDGVDVAKADLGLDLGPNHKVLLDLGLPCLEAVVGHPAVAPSAP